MFLGCIISLAIVFKELFITFYKCNSEKQAIESIKKINPDVRQKTSEKIKIWFDKKSKRARILILPNFFQIISKFYSFSDCELRCYVSDFDFKSGYCQAT